MASLQPLKIVREFTLITWLALILLAFWSAEWIGWGVIATVTPFILSKFVPWKRLFKVSDSPASDNDDGTITNEMLANLTPMHISLFIYSLIGSIVTLGFRRYMRFNQVDPYLDWHVSDLPSRFYGSATSGHGFINEAQVRISLVEIIAICICLFVSLSTIHWISKQANLKTGAIQLHPATALLGIVILLGAVKLPPYELDLIHWSNFIGDALDESQGIWPYIHSTAKYGFLLGPFLLASFKVFSLSKLTIAFLVIILTAIAVIAIYSLINKIVQNKWISLLGVALLLFGFYDLDYAIHFPNTGALRFQTIGSISLLLAWIVLQRHDIVGLISAVLLGILFLWHPMWQGFLLGLLFGYLLYQSLFDKNAMAAKKLIGMVVGALVPIIVIFTFFSRPLTPSDLNIKELIWRTTFSSELYANGFGNLPQYLTLGDMVWFVFALLGIIYLVHNILNHKRLSSEEIFLLCAVLYTIPVLMYHISRTSPPSFNGLAWNMLPVVILVCWLFWGKQNKHHFYGVLIGIGLLLAINQDLTHLVVSDAQQLLLPYESERQEWADACLDELYNEQPCDFGQWPDLREAITSANTPIIDLQDPANQFLINQCQQDIPVYSLIGPSLYWYGDCTIPYQESVIVLSRSLDFEQDLFSYDEVVVDQRTHIWPLYDPFIADIVDILNKQVYCEERLVGSDSISTYKKECDYQPTAHFGNDVELYEWHITSDVNVQQCDTVAVDSVWKFTGYSPSLTLVIANEEGQGISRTDSPLAESKTVMAPEDNIYYRDIREVEIPCDTPPGEYYLMVGAYMFAGSEPVMLPINLPDGTPIGNLLYLTTLYVGQ